MINRRGCSIARRHISTVVSNIFEVRGWNSVKWGRILIYGEWTLVAWRGGSWIGGGSFYRLENDYLDEYPTCSKLCRSYGMVEDDFGRMTIF